MNCSCLTLASFLTPMPENISSMEPTSVLRELMLTPRTSLHHSKSLLQSIRLTSSPTLHFGHWKAAAESDFLSKLHALFTDIIISTSYSPIWWQHGLSVMLEKKKGVCIPSKLRAILLMEANFNFPNKLFFGQCMLQWAESQNQIPREIGGSQNGHQAIDCAIN